MRTDEVRKSKEMRAVEGSSRNAQLTQGFPFSLLQARMEDTQRGSH